MVIVACLVSTSAFAGDVGIILDEPLDDTELAPVDRVQSRSDVNDGVSEDKSPPTMDFPQSGVIPPECEGGLMSPIPLDPKLPSDGSMQRFDPRAPKVVQAPPSVLCWLDAFPPVRNALVWEDAKGARGFANWTFDEVNAFENAFRSYWGWLKSGGAEPESYVDPAPNLVTLGDDDPLTTVIAYEHAWKLYVNTVALSLALEMSGAIPSSILGLDDESLTQLYDSRHFFTFVNEADKLPTGYKLGAAAAYALPAAPGFTWKFIVEQKLIGANRKDTITRLVEWGRVNAQHVGGYIHAGNIEYFYGYRGVAPVSAIMVGATRDAYHQQNLAEGLPSTTWFAHWSPGCHGFNGFLKSVLRLANIPVLYDKKGGHSHAHFPSENRHLSHSDDPYTSLLRTVPTAAPLGSILIGDAKYNSWFGPQLTNAEHTANTSRRVWEFSFQHPASYGNLSDRCADLANATPKATSKIAASYALMGYTVADLDALNFWQNLDAALAGLGGCNKLGDIKDIEKALYTPVPYTP